MRNSILDLGKRLASLPWDKSLCSGQNTRNRNIVIIVIKSSPSGETVKGTQPDGLHSSSFSYEIHFHSSFHPVFYPTFSLPRFLHYSKNIASLCLCSPTILSASTKSRDYFLHFMLTRLNFRIVKLHSEV